MAQLVLAKQATFDKPAKNWHMRLLYLRGYVNGKPLTKMFVDGGAAANVMPFMSLGALGRAPPCLAWDPPWERSKLGFHKISLVQIFPDSQPFLVGAISPKSGLQIMQIRCPGCVTRNYLQLWYSLIRNEDNIPKQSQKIICLISDLSALLAFQGSYLLASWPKLGLPYVQIEAIVEAHNFGSQTFAIRGRLSLWNLHRKIMLFWVARISLGLSWSPSSPRSFTCWCFIPWDIWSYVHFMSWLMTGFMIFSQSAWWTYPKSLLFNVDFLCKQ
jgi:hypothetical protein